MASAPYFCKVCNKEMWFETYWQSHLNGRPHRETVDEQIYQGQLPQDYWQQEEKGEQGRLGQQPPATIIPPFKYPPPLHLKQEKKSESDGGQFVGPIRDQNGKVICTLYAFFPKQ